MFKQNRKAASRLVYGLLIALATALVGFLILFAIANGLIDIEGSKEVLCKTANRWSVGGFCKATNVIIDAKDWEKCDPLFKANFLNAGSDDSEKTKWAKHCAAQQVLYHAYECYNMGGCGSWTPESFMCYTFAIRSDKDIGELTKDALNNYANTVKDKIIKYMEAMGLPKDKDFVRELTSKMEDKKMYGLLEDHYVDVIWAKIYNCSMSEDTDTLNLTYRITDKSEEINVVLDGQIDTSKEGCSNVKSEIQEYINSINEVRPRIAEIDTEIDGLVVEYGIDKSIIDAELVATLSGDIDKFSFDQEFLRELSKEVGPSGADITYSSLLGSSKNIEVLWDIDITQGSFYEMGFCNPDLDLGTGLYDTLVCSSIGVDRGQAVQIAIGGGGAGGLLRTGSPYPGYCDYFTVYKRKDAIGDFLHTPREWCKNIMQAITGPGVGA